MYFVILFLRKQRSQEIFSFPLKKTCQTFAMFWILSHLPHAWSLASYKFILNRNFFIASTIWKLAASVPEKKNPLPLKHHFFSSQQKLNKKLLILITEYYVLTGWSVFFMRNSTLSLSVVRMHYYFNDHLKLSILSVVHNF